MPKCNSCGEKYHRCSSCGWNGETYDVYRFCSEKCWEESEENKLELNIISTKLNELDIEDLKKVADFFNENFIYDDMIRHKRVENKDFQEIWKEVIRRGW